MPKALLLAALRLTGLPLFIRETIQRRRLTILVYHRLDPVTADRHFAALRRWYTPISLQAYLEARRTGATDRLPPKSIIVTIDDGHRSVYQLKDVLLKHRLPVTVFLCSGLLDSNRRFWFSAPGLNDSQRQHLKTVSDETRLRALQALGFENDGAGEERDSLNLSEVRELQEIVDFQSHTVSHPILPACSEEKAAEEIRLSKRDLETRASLRVNALAYPNGSYTARELILARTAGYECALTTQPGFNSAATPLLELKRFTVRDDCGVEELLVRACGLWALLRSARRAAKPAPAAEHGPQLNPRTSQS